MNQFKGKLALQQRVLPSYRVPFFDLLASHCKNGMTLFAGQARSEEMIASGQTQIAEHVEAKNIHLLNSKFYLCYQQGFIKWLEESNPDALIVEANPRYLSTSSAVKWMHKRGRKVIGWGLGFPSPILGEGLGVRVRSRFINQFDGMIAYSQRGAEEYATLGFPREKIFVAHNSVSSKPEKLDDRLLTIDRATILFVGRLQERKRVDSLIRACAEIESNSRLIIVGDGPERENLESLAKNIIHLLNLSARNMGLNSNHILTKPIYLFYPAQADSPCKKP